MRKIFSYFLLTLFVFGWSFNYAADKKDESKVTLSGPIVKTSGKVIKHNAKDAFLAESFEGEFPPAGWTLDPETGETWQQGDGTAHGPGSASDGSYAIYFDDYNFSSGTTASIITPAIDLTSAVNPQLYFDYWDGGGTDYVVVQISTDSVNFTDIYSTPDEVDPWETQNVNLNSYAGSTVYIRFVGTSVYGYSNPYIDNVVVTEGSTTPELAINYHSVDFGLVSVDSSSQYYGFVVSNVGSGTLEFSNVYGLEGTDFYTDFDATITLGAGEADTFTIGFQPLSEGSQYAEMIFESNGGTDTIMVDGFGVDVSDKYVEGFETGVPPADWTTNVLSGSYDWEQYSAAWAIDGEYVAKYNSFSASDGSSAELITPKLDLTTQTDPYVAFYFSHPSSTSYYDSLGVFFSDGDSTWYHVANLVVQDSYWHSYVFYVSDYVPAVLDSTNFQVKFVSYSDYGYSLYLDHVILPPVFASDETVDWCNLQWPPVIDATIGDSITVYGQVYKAGVTEGPGQGADIEVWIGASTENIDPALWPEDTWERAEYNEFGPTDSNDEYMFNTLIDMPPGTYYYTFRYRYNGGPYTYGGYSESGGGFWDGVNNVSGVLNINPVTIDAFPYSESFEGDVFPPVGWVNEDGNWSQGTEAYEGSYCAKVRYTHDGEANLVTPAIVLDPVDPMYISFYWKDDDISKVAGHDTTFFEISSDYGMTWETLDMLSEDSHDTDYHLVMHTLEAYIGQEVMFRWRDVSDNSFSAYGTGVDAITVDYYVQGPGQAYNPYPEDGATDVPMQVTVSWENPAETFYNVLYGSYEDPIAVENMDSSAIVLDGSVDTTVYSFIPAEFPGETTVYWRVVEYAADGSYTIGPVWSFTTETDMHPAPYDFIANNGIGVIPMTWNYVAPPEPNTFFESFENSETIPADWMTVDNDGDGYNWEVWNLFAHSGNNSVASFSYINGVGAVTPDNWLITPQIPLGDNPLLSFWAGASDTAWYLEHFQVLVSTTDDSLGSFTNVMLDEVLNTPHFTEYVVDLSAFANQNIYIAFVHNNVTDQFNLSFDDISVTGIVKGKDLNFTFENPNDIKQFRRVSIASNTLPLKKSDKVSDQEFKENLDRFATRNAHKEFAAPKGFANFNVYRDDELVGTSDVPYFEDYSMPSYYTPYGYYVTAVYSDGVESAPSNVDSAFALDPNDVIFMDSFEDGELPPYYTVVNANNDDYTWEAYHGYALTGEYSMSIRWNSSMAMDDWVFIGPIQMYGGENYNLNFGYRAASSTWTENMAVFVTSAIDTVEANMVELFREEGIGNTSYEYYGTDFNIAVDGQYYIAFHGYSAPDMYRLAVDDILLMGNGELVGQQDSSIVFFDDFENGTDNWELLGGWGLTEAEFTSPTHSLTESPNGNYPDNAIYLATMNEGVDLSNYFDAQVEFMTKYEIEQGFDYMYLDVTYDGAKSWINLTSFDGVVSDWTQIVVPLGGFVGHTGVKLRFRFESDAGYNMDGMYIDDFTIRVSNEDTTPPLVVAAFPEDYEGAIDDFILPAEITDISGIALANIIYAPLNSVDTVIYSLPADSVMGDTYYFHVPKQDAGTLVAYALVVADSAGNIDTVDNNDEPYFYIAGNYLNFDDNEVTYVLNVPQNYMVAKRMSIPDGTETHLVTALIRNYTDANRPNGNIMVHVWADNNGVPGEDLITPFEMVPAANLDNPYEMTVADLVPFSNELWMHGDFWIGFEVPGDEVWVTLGRELDDTRSFVYDPSSGQWAMYTREFQFRAITDEFYQAGDVQNVEIPKKFDLMQNYPNPFNPTTIIKYALPKEAHVTLKVYNALGQEVATLVNQTVDAGYHEINFNASNLASGMYIYRIQAGNFVSVKKMLLLK